jgi:hypothetical protein
VELPTLADEPFILSTVVPTLGRAAWEGSADIDGALLTRPNRPWPRPTDGRGNGPAPRRAGGAAPRCRWSEPVPARSVRSITACRVRQALRGVAVSDKRNTHSL